MAKRWLVKDDDGFIGGFTEDDDVDAPAGYTATAIAADATGVPADGPRSGGGWDVATSTYTLSQGQMNETDTDIINAFQKQRLHEAYKHFQIHGRTEHWHHLRDPARPCNRRPSMRLRTGGPTRFQPSATTFWKRSGPQTRCRRRTRSSR